jgi:hypothetical protein
MEPAWVTEDGSDASDAVLLAQFNSPERTVHLQDELLHSGDSLFGRLELRALSSVSMGCFWVVPLIM